MGILSSKISGGIHPVVMIQNFASCLNALGKSEEALPLLDEAIYISERKEGVSSIQALVPKMEKARALEFLQRYVEAEATARQLLEPSNCMLTAHGTGLGHSNRLLQIAAEVPFLLARILKLQGEISEAEKFFQEALGDYTM